MHQHAVSLYAMSMNYLHSDGSHKLSIARSGSTRSARYAALLHTSKQRSKRPDSCTAIRRLFVHSCMVSAKTTIARRTPATKPPACAAKSTMGKKLKPPVTTTVKKNDAICVLRSATSRGKVCLQVRMMKTISAPTRPHIAPDEPTLMVLGKNNELAMTEYTPDRKYICNHLQCPHDASNDTPSRSCTKMFASKCKTPLCKNNGLTSRHHSPRIIMRATFFAPITSRKYGCGPNIIFCDHGMKPLPTSTTTKRAITCSREISVAKDNRKCLHARRALGTLTGNWFFAQHRNPPPHPIIKHGKQPKTHLWHAVGLLPTKSRSPQTGSDKRRSDCVDITDSRSALGDSKVNCVPVFVDASNAVACRAMAKAWSTDMSGCLPVSSWEDSFPTEKDAGNMSHANRLACRGE